MNAKNISLVQESFKQVAPIAETAADIFYNRLFEIAPQFRPLFKGDIKAQGQMLMGALAMAVNGLSKPEALVPTIQKLGARHKGYGIKPEYYETVGEALLYTLEKGLGDGFTLEVRVAWAEAYGVLSGLMIEASEAV